MNVYSKTPARCLRILLGVFIVLLPHVGSANIMNDLVGWWDVKSQSTDSKGKIRKSSSVQNIAKSKSGDFILTAYTIQDGRYQKSDFLTFKRNGVFEARTNVFKEDKNGKIYIHGQAVGKGKWSTKRNMVSVNYTANYKPFDLSRKLNVSLFRVSRSRWDVVATFNGQGERGKETLTFTRRKSPPF